MTHASMSTLRGEEEANSTLSLGEFDNVPTLNLSEARVLINVMIANRLKSRQHFVETETLQKMQAYLDSFVRFKDRETVQALSRMLETNAAHLQYFERAQLVSLCPETADEAKTLVPSLASKISDTDLQDILDHIAKRRNFAQ